MHAGPPVGRQLQELHAVGGLSSDPVPAGHCVAGRHPFPLSRSGDQPGQPAGHLAGSDIYVLLVGHVVHQTGQLHPPHQNPGHLGRQAPDVHHQVRTSWTPRVFPLPVLGPAARTQLPVQSLPV